MVRLNLAMNNDRDQLLEIAVKCHDFLCVTRFRHDPNCNTNFLHKSRFGCSCGLDGLRKAIDNYLLDAPKEVRTRFFPTR